METSSSSWFTVTLERSYTSRLSTITEFDEIFQIITYKYENSDKLNSAIFPFLLTNIGYFGLNDEQLQFFFDLWHINLIVSIENEEAESIFSVAHALCMLLLITLCNPDRVKDTAKLYMNINDLYSILSNISFLDCEEEEGEGYFDYYPLEIKFLHFLIAYFHIDSFYHITVLVKEITRTLEDCVIRNEYKYEQVQGKLNLFAKTLYEQSLLQLILLTNSDVNNSTVTTTSITAKKAISQGTKSMLITMISCFLLKLLHLYSFRSEQSYYHLFITWYTANKSNHSNSSYFLQHEDWRFTCCMTDCLKESFLLFPYQKSTEWRKKMAINGNNQPTKYPNLVTLVDYTSTKPFHAYFGGRKYHNWWIRYKAIEAILLGVEGREDLYWMKEYGRIFITSTIQKEKTSSYLGIVLKHLYGKSRSDEVTTNNGNNNDIANQQQVTVNGSTVRVSVTTRLSHADVLNYKIHVIKQMKKKWNVLSVETANITEISLDCSVFDVCSLMKRFTRWIDRLTLIEAVLLNYNGEDYTLVATQMVDEVFRALFSEDNLPISNKALSKLLEATFQYFIKVKIIPHIFIEFLWTEFCNATGKRSLYKDISMENLIFKFLQNFKDGIQPLKPLLKLADQLLLSVAKDDEVCNQFLYNCLIGTISSTPTEIQAIMEKELTNNSQEYPNIVERQWISTSFLGIC